MIKSRNVATGGLRPYNQSDNWRLQKYYFESFRAGEQPLHYYQTSGLPVVPTAALTAQGQTIHAVTPRGGYYQIFLTTAQDILPTGTVGTGLDLGCDQVDNQALEIVPGGNSTKSRFAMVAGTDSDFFFRAKFILADVAGSDQWGIGFRKQETFAVPTSILSGGAGIYTDFALLGFADATGTDVFTATSVGSAVTVATDTLFNAANTVPLDLTVRVVKRKVRYYINGVELGGTVVKDGDGAAITAQPTTSAASYTFTSALTLIPFIFLRQDAALSNGHCMVEWEIGHTVDIGLDPAAE